MGSAVETSETPKKALAVAQPLLDLFWELAEFNQVKQAHAAAKLVQQLKTDAVKEEEPEGEEAGHIPSNIDYCFNRLVRGLASNRKGARWGYGAALTVLLQEFPSIRTTKILQDMENLLRINSPQDMKSVGVGRLTLYMILVNSGRIADITASNLRLVVEGLFQLEREKAYLKSGAQEILKQLVNKVPVDHFERILLPQLKTHIAKPLSEMDLDSLYLLFKTSQSHEKTLRPIIKQNLGSPDIFATANVPAICKLLMKTTVKNDVYHPAVLEFADEFVSRPAAFADFWLNMVTLASAETPWKARIPLDIVQHLLKRTENPVNLSLILTKPFLVYLFRNSAEKRGISDGLKALYLSATKALQDVFSAVHKETDQKVLMEIVDNVLETDPTDDIPKNKSWSHFVSGVLRRLDAGNAASISDRLIATVNVSAPHAEHAIRIIHMLEQICFDKIRSVADVATFRSVLHFLARTAYPKNTEINQQVTDAAKKDLGRFITSSAIDMHAHGKQKNPLWSGSESKKDLLVKLAVIESIIVDKEAAVELEHEAIRKDALSLNTKIKNLQVNVVFQQVLQLMALSVAGFWIHTQPVLCREIIDELTTLHKNLKKQGKQAEDSEIAEKILPFLMSLLAVNKWMFPTVELVFRNLCPFLDEKSLDVIVEVLQPESTGDDDETMDFESSGEENEDDDGSELEDSEESPEDISIDRAVLKQVPGIADENDEESEPDMDDDAMFQLDEVLANIMRARKAEKNKSDEEVDPRLRALQFISIYCSFRESDPLLILSIVLPIMRVANEKSQGAQRQKHSLLVNAAGRSLNVLKMHRKWEIKEIHKQVYKEDITETFKELIAESGKVHELKLFQQFSEGVLFGLRILLLYTAGLPKGTPFLKDLLINILQDFATKRGSAFAHTLMDKLVNCSNEYAVSILPEVLKIVFSQDETKKYLAIRQAQLCAITSNVLRSSSKTAGVSKDEMKTFMLVFGTEYSEYMKRLAEAAEPIKVKKLLEETTDLARMIISWHGKLRKSSVEIESLGYFWNLEEMEELADKLLKAKLEAPECKAAKRSVVALKVALASVQKKANARSAEEAEEPQEKPAKKAKRESAKKADKE